MTRQLQILVMIGLALAAGCSETVASRAVLSTFTRITIHQPEAEKLTLELRTVHPVIQSGQWVPLVLTLTNNSEQPATIIAPGDGSAWGWRTPVIRWSHDLYGGLPRCGNINALTAAEIVTLGPGEKMDFHGWGISSPSLPGAGKHQLKVEMQHDPDLQWKGIPLGEHEPAAMDAVRRLNAYKLVSNTIEIEVIDP